MSHVQLGFVVEGLATNMPGAAPGAREPLGPRLFKMPWRAIGLSDAIKLEREPVARGRR